MWRKRMRGCLAVIVLVDTMTRVGERSWCVPERRGNPRRPSIIAIFRTVRSRAGRKAEAEMALRSVLRPVRMRPPTSLGSFQWGPHSVVVVTMVLTQADLRE